jgi:prophage antirepressor-like protein
MNNLPQIFDFQSSQVRVIIQDGDPWFAAKDICDVLEISNSRDAVGRLDDDEKDVALTDTPGGPQNMTIVNESGLYALILTSRKPEAKTFKRWITHEVMPQIRKTGSYVASSCIEDLIIMQAQAMKDMRLEMTETKLQVTENAQQVQAIKEALLPNDKEWRKGINEKINQVAKACDADYHGVRSSSYKLLEQRGACNLSRRVQNLKNRLSESGATKTTIDKACKLDAIESDKRLKEIYSTIVREMVVKYVA